MMWMSKPIEVGPGTVAHAIHVPNTKRAIVDAVGRKGLLGHRGPSLVAVAAAALARAQIFGSAPEAAVGSGVVAWAPFASDAAVLEVDQLATESQHRRVSILDAPNVSPNVVSAAASIRLGAKGPAFTVDGLRLGPVGALGLASTLLSAGRCREVFLLEITDPFPTADGLPIAVATVLACAPSETVCHEIPEVDGFYPMERPAPSGSAVAAVWGAVANLTGGRR